jgi:hypothetical protein
MREGSSPHASKDSGNSNVKAHHERFVDAKRVNQGDKNYSAQVSYKVPNINYNTALRSSKRRSSPQKEDDNIVYYRR